MVAKHDNIGKRLLTRRQVAEKYAIDPKNVTRFERQGKIPARIPNWIGAEPRWLESDIDRHIDEMAQAARREQVA